VLDFDGVPDFGDEELELTAAVARGGDAGGEERGAELDAGVVRVHLPQAGQDGLAVGVDDAGAGWECVRSLRANGGDALLRMMTVEFSTAGAPVASMRRAPTMAKLMEAEWARGAGEVGEVEHLLTDAALDEGVEGGAVLVEDFFLRQAASEGHESGDAFAVVHPKDFATEDEIGDGVAGEADDLLL
jgi:hypothetical protein